MGSLTIWHWIIVVVVLALLFLRGNLSDLLDDMARAIHALRYRGLPAPIPTPIGGSGFRVRNAKALLFIASAVAAAVAIWLVERLAN